MDLIISVGSRNKHHWKITYSQFHAHGGTAETNVCWPCMFKRSSGGVSTRRGAEILKAALQSPPPFPPIPAYLDGGLEYLGYSPAQWIQRHLAKSSQNFALLGPASPSSYIMSSQGLSALPGSAAGPCDDEPLALPRPPFQWSTMPAGIYDVHIPGGKGRIFHLSMQNK